MEICWYADKHQALGKEPLDCLKCKRMKGKTIMDMPEDPELKPFVEGYRLAVLEFAAYIGDSLTKEQIAMAQGIDLRFKCALDRGATIEDLRKTLEIFTKPMLSDLLKGGTLCPILDPTSELYGTTPEKARYKTEQCDSCPRFKECWKQG
jgi:hypothetical protein